LLASDDVRFFRSTGRGVSNCTSGKEELAACDETLPGPIGCTFKQKSNKLVDSALRERIQMATMKRERPVSPASVSAVRETPHESGDETPWNVSQAAQFLGVSPQTVYVWVERKQIPHLRVMGRTIRFLRGDLERFRATFRRGPEETHVLSK
jgi:excisionase family DNA binding protein